MISPPKSTRPTAPPERSRIRAVLLVIVLVLVAVGCGGDRDDREEKRNQLGEPDDIQFIEGPISDFEYWTYYDYPTEGENTELRFERARNTCGANRNWILVLSRTYTPGASGAGIIAPPGDPGGHSVNPIKP